MKAFEFYPDKCDLCRKCEIACSEKIRTFRSDEIPSSPHIRIFVAPSGPMVRICHHCEEPPCVDACIGESLYISVEGTICQDINRCVGCFMCNMVCPHAALITTVSLKKAFKCNLSCGSGELPACVIACDRGALLLEEDFNMALKRTKRNRFKKAIRK